MKKLDLEKTEEPEVKLPTSVESSKKQESSKKNLLLDQSKLWKILKRDGSTKPADLPLEKSVFRSRSNS